MDLAKNVNQASGSQGIRLRLDWGLGWAGLFQGTTLSTRGLVLHSNSQLISVDFCTVYTSAVSTPLRVWA